MMSGLQIPLDLQNLLKDWGVTFTVLAVAAASFLVILFFSFREFISWFTRAGKVLKIQREILIRVEALERSNEKQLSLLRDKIESAAKPVNGTLAQTVQIPTVPAPAAVNHRFPLGPQASEKPVSFTID